jgi:hypothetical protein
VKVCGKDVCKNATWENSYLGKTAYIDSHAPGTSDYSAESSFAWDPAKAGGAIKPPTVSDRQNRPRTTSSHSYGRSWRWNCSSEVPVWPLHPPESALAVAGPQRRHTGRHHVACPWQGGEARAVRCLGMVPFKEQCYVLRSFWG